MLQLHAMLAAQDAHQVDLVAAYPVFVAVGAGLIGLILKIIMRHRATRPTIAVTLLGLFAAALTARLHLTPDPTLWHPLMGLMQLDPLAALAQTAIFAIAALLTIAALPRLHVMGERAAEFLVVLTFAVSGLAVVVAALDLLTLFTGLALVLICNYILLAMRPRDPLGIEAGLKYFVTSLVAVSLFLFGAAMLYAAAGDTQFHGLADGLARLQSAQYGTAIIALALIMAGLAWMIGLAPMHMHIPDLYQAAPPPTAGYIAALPPLATLFLLARLLAYPLLLAAPVIRPTLAAVALLTMVAGALLAWAQTSTRRAVGYISMVVVAALLLPLLFTVTQPEMTAAAASMPAVILALAVTMLFSLGVLAAMIARIPDDDPPAKTKPAPPTAQNAVSRLVAAGMAFFIALMLIAFALTLVVNADDSGQAAWFWIAAIAATVAASRMSLIFAAFGLRMPLGLSAGRQTMAAIWLLVVLVLAVAPVIWAMINQEQLARLLYDSLRGGI